VSLITRSSCNSKGVGVRYSQTIPRFSHREIFHVPLIPGFLSVGFNLWPIVDAGPSHPHLPSWRALLRNMPNQHARSVRSVSGGRQVFCDSSGVQNLAMAKAQCQGISVTVRLRLSLQCTTPPASFAQCLQFEQMRAEGLLKCGRNLTMLAYLHFITLRRPRPSLTVMA